MILNNSFEVSQFPKALYIELTSNCNLHCPMCRPLGYKGQNMDLDMYSEIANALFSDAVFVDLRGWGESTILPNFLEYLEIALEKTTSVKLISNGAIRNDEIWHELGSKGIELGLSIDAADNNLFKQLRKGGDLTTVISNINTYKQAAKANHKDFSKSLYFLITVSGDNLSDVTNILQLGYSLGVSKFRLECITVPSNHSANLKFHKFDIVEVMEDIKILAPQLGINVEFNSSLHHELTDSSKARKVCIHPWTYLYIDATGRLGFCDHLNGQSAYTFGHWKEGIDSFMFGNQMKELRREHLELHRNGKAISMCDDCNWCYERRYVDYEYLVDPRWEQFRYFYDS
jgi:radical SAM protein with 4Fe4S-binding SPASM domain